MSDTARRWTLRRRRTPGRQVARFEAVGKERDRNALAVDLEVFISEGRRIVVALPDDEGPSSSRN